MIYILALPHWLPALTHSSLESAGLITRSLASVAVILPAGVLMGFGFPYGMKLVMSQDARPTPWFWGIDGAAGVQAAGVAVACSITFSIDTTIPSAVSALSHPHAYGAAPDRSHRPFACLLRMHNMHPIPIRPRQCCHERLAALDIQLTWRVVGYYGQYLLKDMDGVFPMLGAIGA